MGIYFITQSPTDIPENILGQLGNRVQHALRAYTPKDQKAVKTAAETFRANPGFDTYEAILQLETGEALVSFLDEKGAPSMVERAKILFPLSQIGAITEDQRAAIIKQSRLWGRYDKVDDRESAYEILMTAQAEIDRQRAEDEAQKESEKQAAIEAKEQARLEKEQARLEKEQARLEKEKARKSKNSIASKVLRSVITAVTGVVAASVADTVSNKVSGTRKKAGTTSTTQKAVKKATRSATSTITRELTRSILGNLVKK